jgi:hypothetical protein
MESQKFTETTEHKTIVAASGKPFKTVKAAQSAIKQKGLDSDSCNIIEASVSSTEFTEGYVIEVQGSEQPNLEDQPTNQPKPTNQLGKGHVVKEENPFDDETQLQTIYKAPGKPFLSAKEAKDFMRRKRINPGSNRVIQLDDNAFGIYGDGQLAPDPPKEKYFRVSFQARATENDPEDVTLSVNGETLVIQREKEVIIPGRFKECADHALIRKFKQLPDMPRKIEAPIKLFPYSQLGEATEEEYLAAKAAGDKATSHNIKKYGFNVSPEMVDGQ